MITLPAIAPTVLTATSEPDSEPAWRASSRQQRRRGREAQAEHDGHRQDHEDGRPDQRLQGLQRLAPGDEGLWSRRRPRRGRP